MKVVKNKKSYDLEDDERDLRDLSRYKTLRGIGSAEAPNIAVGLATGVLGGPYLGHPTSPLVGRWRGIRKGEELSRRGASDDEIVSKGSRHGALVGGGMALGSGLGTLGVGTAAAHYLKEKGSPEFLNLMKKNKGKLALGTGLGAAVAAGGSYWGTETALRTKMARRDEALRRKHDR